MATLEDLKKLKSNTVSGAVQNTLNFLKENNIIEEIISEPIGGAHRDHSLSIKNVEESIKKALKKLARIT